MHSQITCTREVNFTGRNGYFRQSGLDVMSLYDDQPALAKVMLSPVTSRGSVGRCDLEIPRESIPALIEALRKIAAEEVQS